MPLPFRRTAFGCSVALLWCASAAQAQSLLTLYNTAQGYDAPLQSARAALQASQASADQARAGLLPQVGLQAGADRNYLDAHIGSSGSSREYNTLNGALVGSQPLYRPANRITWDQGKKQVQVAQEQFAAAEQDLIVRLAQAYFDVLNAEDTLFFVRAFKGAVTEQLESAKRNFEVGNATITDSLEAQSRYDLATAQEVASENDLRVKKLALDQLVGQAGTHPQPLTLPVTLPEPQPDNVGAWVNQALDNHPAIQQSRTALDVARLETDKAKTGHLPTVDLQANVAQTRYPDGNPSISAAPHMRYRATTASVGVVLNWPLFAGFAVENRIRETLALEDKALADLDNAQRSVAQATRSAFFGVQSGLGQVKALEAAEHSSKTSLDANLLSYQVGVRINIDVLNAQTQLYQTRRDLAKARYDVLLGMLQLKQASGVLALSDVQQINALLKPREEGAAPTTPSTSASTPAATPASTPTTPPATPPAKVP
ncbi:TolC family outer membrane protein [Ottowia sp.]|uniref:TolC family outer membrane protein n=1 Tax=Ottowia sp. TaxID=1898956 RepID=UPI003A87FA29